MPDPFQAALAETLPALKSLKMQRRKSTASRESLERLRNGKKSPAPASSKVREPAADILPPAKDSQPRELPDMATFATMDELRAAALTCTRCPHLVRSRTQVVVGVGNPKADLMFVGEAPGADEDLQGEPFVGRAGQLLTKIINAMGFTREQIYIANVLKCRPDMPEGSPGNRKPKREEMETCLPWLQRQVELVAPKAIVALGATAVEGLLGVTEPVGKLRGRWLEFRSIPVMVTYHPAYLLRNQTISEKRKVWEDMLQVLEKLGLPISEKQRRFFTASSE